MQWLPMPVRAVLAIGEASIHVQLLSGENCTAVRKAIDLEQPVQAHIVKLGDFKGTVARFDLVCLETAGIHRCLALAFGYLQYLPLV